MSILSGKEVILDRAEYFISENKIVNVFDLLSPGYNREDINFILSSAGYIEKEKDIFVSSEF